MSLNLDERWRETLRHAVAIALQTCVAQIGFIPDEAGARVLQLFSSDNPHELMRLGVALETCRDSRSYASLMRDLG